MMKVLQKLLFSAAVIVGLSVAVPAQKDDKKPPPKEKPPVVVPEKKDRPPKPEPTPKKPGSNAVSPFLFWKIESA